MKKEKANFIAEMTDDQWRAVMASRCEAALLNMAENRSHKIPDFLEVLEADYKAREDKRTIGNNRA